MSIWLIGNRGMLGTELEGLLRAAGAAYVATDRELDIRDPKALAEFAGEHRRQRIEWVVNCSGYTAVDRAEDEPEAAFQVNADGVENIARAAARLHARLVHISTDYVFSGQQHSPYTEEDPPAPLGVYGASKLEGERRLQGITDRHYILRTAWLYSSHGSNFLGTMLRLFRETQTVRVVADQRGSPTYARDLAEALLRIIGSGAERFGVYHFTNAGQATWYDFARLILELAEEKGLVGSGVRLQSIATQEYPTRALRPAYSCLCTDRIRKVFGITPRRWQDALEDCLQRSIQQPCANSPT